MRPDLCLRRCFGGNWRARCPRMSGECLRRI